METKEVCILYENVLYRQGEQREQGGRNMCPVMYAVMNMLALPFFSHQAPPVRSPFALAMFLCDTRSYLRLVFLLEIVSLAE